MAEYDERLEIEILRESLVIAHFESEKRRVVLIYYLEGIIQCRKSTYKRQGLERAYKILYYVLQTRAVM